MRSLVGLDLQTLEQGSHLVPAAPIRLLSVQTRLAGSRPGLVLTTRIQHTQTCPQTDGLHIELLKLVTVILKHAPELMGQHNKHLISFGWRE